MSKYLLAIVITAILAIAGCKKDDASKWTGTYTATNADTINQVTITEVNSTTLKMQLQVAYGSVSYAFVTLQDVKLTNATSAVINESGYINNVPVTFQFAGSASLSGNTLTVNGTGTNSLNSADIRYYTFIGNK